MPILGHRFHATGGSSDQHASLASLQTGPYGGIDQIVPGDIGAAGFPKVVNNFQNGQTTNSAVDSELVFVAPPAGLFIYPFFIYANISSSSNVDAFSARFRFTFNDATTVDTATGAASAANQGYMAAWGFPLATPNSDSWGATLTDANLISRLVSGSSGKKINRISLRGSTAGGATGTVLVFNVGYFLV